MFEAVGPHHTQRDAFMERLTMPAFAPQELVIVNASNFSFGTRSIFDKSFVRNVMWASHCVP
jgi:hypothetical protein